MSIAILFLFGLIGWIWLYTVSPTLAIGAVIVGCIWICNKGELTPEQKEHFTKGSHPLERFDGKGGDR